MYGIRSSRVSKASFRRQGLGQIEQREYTEIANFSQWHIKQSLLQHVVCVLESNIDRNGFNVSKNCVTATKKQEFPTLGIPIRGLVIRIDYGNRNCGNGPEIALRERLKTNKTVE